MRRARPRIGWTLWLTAALWLAVVPAANAYIDAGTTAIVFQAVVAGLAAAGMFLRIFWRRITGFFGREPDEGNAEGDAGR